MIACTTGCSSVACEGGEREQDRFHAKEYDDDVRVFLGIAVTASLLFPIRSAAQNVSDYNVVQPGDAVRRCNSLLDLQLKRCDRFDMPSYLRDLSARHRAIRNGEIEDMQNIERSAIDAIADIPTARLSSRRSLEERLLINAGKASLYQTWLKRYESAGEGRAELRRQITAERKDSALRIDVLRRRSQLKTALKRSSQAEERDRIQENIDRILEYRGR